MNPVIQEIYSLYLDSGSEQYFGEDVTKTQHAEQCAWHASQAGADEELILAALLHDIGHLLDTPDAQRDERIGVINHDELGARWLLDRGFSPRLAALVGGHVDAKRYLTATNPSYFHRLSPASVETLALQGGPMQLPEAQDFAESPYLRDILRLRSWDEMAKDPEWVGPDFRSYENALVQHLAPHTPSEGHATL